MNERNNVNTYFSREDFFNDIDTERTPMQFFSRYVMPWLLLAVIVVGIFLFLGYILQGALVISEPVAEAWKAITQ